MGAIRAGVGLVSGIDTNSLIKQLLTLQSGPKLRLQSRVEGLQATSAAMKALEANLLTLTTSIQDLSNPINFSKFEVANSDDFQLDAKANADAIPGTYEFQTVRKATAFQALSHGFANADQQAVGTTQLVIQNGGHVHERTLLDSLNGGNGVQRGVIRITDRAGNTSNVDLSDAFSVDDVLDAINSNDSINIKASTLGGKIVLSDTSASIAGNLTVTDVGSGQTASDLGIAKSVDSSSLTGDDVLVLTGEFTLDQLNDGNGVRLLKGAPDIRFTTADVSTFEVNLDNAFNLNDVVAAVNDAEGNDGKVTASLTNGRLQLTDTTTGTTAFTVEDINSTNVVNALGIDTAAGGNTITGRRLLAGINSVLLSNLRGGQGIDTIGEVSFTDRTGTTAVVDFSGAESLDEILAAINAVSKNGGGQFNFPPGFEGLEITAQINASGTGIEIVDTSSATASNLIIADVGGSTLASQLGIAVNAAQDSVDSGSLNRRYLNEAASIAGWASGGGDIDFGSIRIVDSAGNEDVIEITPAVKNIGDVLQRINSSSTLQVTAALNDTGDGFVLTDDAGGAGTLRVEDIDADTAEDLRILGEAVTGGDGKQRISSRRATVIDVEATDTLNDVVQKINDVSGFATASVFDDGSAFNAHRLIINGNETGAGGRLAIADSAGLFGFNVTGEARDALLRVGSDPATGFLLASETNNFSQPVTGINVEALNVASNPAKITVTRDDSDIVKAMEDFVNGFNTYIDAADDATSFNLETEERGILQGNGTLLRTRFRLDNLVSRRFNGFGDITSLRDLGVQTRSNGKLELDTDKFEAVLASNRSDVERFLLDEEDGFAKIAEDVLNSLTDADDGAFALEANSLQTSIDGLNDRIETLDAILLRRQERLIFEFAGLEDVLSSLNVQQAAISRIQQISVAPAPTGVF